MTACWRGGMVGGTPLELQYVAMCARYSLILSGALPGNVISVPRDDAGRDS